MADIAFDAASGGFVNPDTSKTVSHTCSGTDRLLFVDVVGDGTSDFISGVTYNGVSMTLITKGQGSGRWLYSFYLIAPASGTHDIIASASSSCYIEINASSYNNAAQVAPEASSAASFSAGVSSKSQSVTTLTDRAWVVLFGLNQSGTPAGGSGTTLRNGALVGSILDSGGVVTPAASKTLTVTQASNGEMGAIAVAFAPVGATDPVIAADQGAFALTGQTAGLLFNRTLVAANGSYALTGQDVTLQKDTPGAYNMPADAGSYAWNGSDALGDYAMNAGMGSYALTGQDVTFSRTYPQNYTLSADGGSYTFNGQNARLDWSGAPIVPNRQIGIYMGMRIGL